MKRSLAVFGVLGLVGCFLPVMVGSESIFELRHFDVVRVILMFAAFGFPLLAGLQPGPTTVGSALTGLGCFGYLVVKFRLGLWDLVVDGDAGGKMIAIAAAGGFVASLAALALSRMRAR
jgi:hypothetical protein